jgi:cyclic pyranopterin phosphate synthase
MKKGDVLACAQVAGIMAAKKTSELIPMCHPVALTAADIEFSLSDELCTVTIRATTRCNGETGVEMEAMTAVSAAALTVYDMCKAVQRDITIEQVRLIRKSGGKSGDYIYEEENDKCQA